MTWPHAILLLIAGILAGAINSVAGGGGFIAFPALLFTGIPPVNANATNTIALWPGTVASTGAYRKEIAGNRHWKMLLPLFATSLLGAGLGAWLLLRTPQATFMRLVPWLLLGATVLFTFAGKVNSWARALSDRPHGEHSPAAYTGMLAIQLAIATYIGYFGAGAGILMLALLAVMGMENIHAMNGFKTLLASCANGIAVVMFIVAGVVVWPQALVVTAGSVVGGYGGAWYAQKLDPAHVRYIIIATGTAMTVYFFWKNWNGG